MKTLQDKENELDTKYQSVSNQSKKSVETLDQKIESLKEQYIKDCAPFDETNMGEVLSNLGSLKGKWINKLTDFETKRNHVYQNMQKIRRDLFEFYKKDYDIKIDNKDEMNMFIESDPRYEYISTLHKQMKAMMVYCENAVNNLNQKQWEIQRYQKERDWREGR